MNIYEKIEKMFNERSEKELYEEILKELKEIKNILKMEPKQYKKEYQKTLPKEYYDFVNKFREEMKPDARKGIDPEINFEGTRLGVNEKGLLYDKNTNKILPTYRAFYVYEKLFCDYRVIL